MTPRLALLLCCLLLRPLAAAADDPAGGVWDDRIVFGQSAALSGPASALGLEMRLGILAAFEEANRKGGVGGRRLELFSYDDRYEPELAIANTLRLIETDHVFALIGPVGTPTSLAAAPVAVAAGVPFIAPFTGAELLRDPALSTVVNLRASYFQETEQIVQWLTADRGFARIAVLYQDDSYGRAGLEGMRQALQRRGLAAVSEGAYLRNTTAVKRALLAIARGRPQAVVIIGAYEPSAAFIRWAHKLALDALMVNVSFVGSNALVQALGADGEGSLISQVVPPPHTDSLPVLAEYRAALAAAAPDAEAGFVSLEGYLAGRLAIRVLEALGPEPTRAAFLATLPQLGRIDLGGFLLQFGPEDNQGSDAVYLTEISDGHVVALDDAGP